ncbi:MAG: cardiolipin synthase ClsB [Janthinobacterium lividum]
MSKRPPPVADVPDVPDVPKAADVPSAASASASSRVSSALRRQARTAGKPDTPTDERFSAANQRPRRLRGWRAARLRFTTGNRLRLFSSGEDYFIALAEKIDAAREEVLIETYMFCDDASTRPVSDALKRAAGRGVDVRIITDGIGTARLKLFDEWAAAGVHHQIYNPHLFGRLGFSRTHRKLAVIDRVIAYVGGINIVCDLIAGNKHLDEPRWDFALEAVGPVVEDVERAIRTQWRRLDTGYAGRTPWPRWRRMSAGEAYGTKEAGVAQPQAAFVARDNISNRGAIEKAYLYAIHRAADEIVLANPYFVPGRRLRRALMNAAQRGVDVKLLIGRKEFLLLDYAVPSLYSALLKAGVKIAEYDKTMLHGKVAVIDRVWATVGSSNLDALSLLVNHEANLVIVNHAESIALRAAILSAFEESRRIDPAHYVARPWTERSLNWLAYAFYRTVMKALTVGRYD